MPLKLESTLKKCLAWGLVNSSGYNYFSCFWNRHLLSHRVSVLMPRPASLQNHTECFQWVFLWCDRLAFKCPGCRLLTVTLFRHTYVLWELAFSCLAWSLFLFTVPDLTWGLVCKLPEQQSYSESAALAADGLYSSSVLEGNEFLLKARNPGHAELGLPSHSWA